MTGTESEDGGALRDALLRLSNWGRWERSDLGTLNLIDDAARLRGLATARRGRTVSLSRAVDPALGSCKQTISRQSLTADEAAGYESEVLEIRLHGVEVTHVDALSHVWAEFGAWDGSKQLSVGSPRPSPWGSIDAWARGIVTRAHLIDVPRHRGCDYVVPEQPVTAEELHEIVLEDGLQILAGDAVAVYSGRERFSADHKFAWGADPDVEPGRPGLHFSCLEFLRHHDCSVLLWDMMDEFPHPLGLSWGVHLAIPLLGLAIVDNALLEPLAVACAEERTHTFTLLVSPLAVAGGTGSPVNPLAIL